jgi:hypothetical protein
MLRKIPMILLFVGLVVSLALIVGCSTKKPWEPSAAGPLQLVLVSGPDTATAVPNGSYASFNWIARGGSEKITGYQWYLEPLEADYNTASLATTAFYPSLAGAADGATYIFHARVTDDAGHTALVERTFTVSDTLPPPPADTTAPTVTINSSLYWLRGAYIATNSIVEFSWTGDDHKGNGDTLQYQFIFTPTNDTSLWIVATSAVFNQVPATDPAVFKVRAQDQAGNISEWDTLTFTIRDATILYVDDYLWLDALGNTDVIKELEQKQFYRDILSGYAYAEWDIAMQGTLDSSDLVVGVTPRYRSIVFCSDSELGTTSGVWADSSFRKVMAYYMENEGHLLLAGALTLIDMNYDPSDGPTVRAGDFSFDWLGIDSTAWCYDYWQEMTWVVKDSVTAYDLPDSTKIDVAKNSAQLDYATETPGLQANSEVIFRWGLTKIVHPSPEPPSYEPGSAYHHPVGHITTISGNVRSAMLNFDTFSMPKEDITRTFRAILGEFGE